MDEPTNDLDVETLELLEEKLSDFEGTLLITSHDRDFLDQVVTSTIVFEGGGKIAEYIGGYEDWVRQTGGVLADESTFGAGRTEDLVEAKSDEAPAVKLGKVSAEAKPATKPAVKKKLSYKVQRELESLPAKIEELESELSALNVRMSDASFYAGEPAEIEAAGNRLVELEGKLAEAMERWLELEEDAGL
jgi:ATP-binding cassette subfamily F protein uup